MPQYTKTIVLLALVACLKNLSAQTEDPVLKSRIKALTETWKDYSTKRNLSDTVSSVQPVIKLFSGDMKNAALAYENEVKRIESELYHRDPAINADVSYIENFKPSVNQDDDNLVYYRRLMAGVNWSVLQNGFLSNRYDEKISKNDIRINEMLSPLGAKENLYAGRWNQLIYLFNIAKIEVLEKRKKLLNEVTAIAEDLHFAKYITREDYIRVVTRKAEIEAQLQVYAGYNESFYTTPDTSGITATGLPLIDLNYARVLQTIDSTIKDSVLLLYRENLELQNKFTRDISLSTGIRYNFYDLITPVNRSFYSWVIGVSVPLPFNLKKRDELTEAQVKLNEFRLDEKFTASGKELMNEMYEYRYKLKQYIGFNQKKVLYDELLRKQQAALKLDPIRFNPMDAVLLLDDAFAIETELLDLKQNLYLKLLRIYTKSNVSDLNELVHVFELPNYFDMDEKTHKSVYVWSGIFEKKSVAFIKEYIIYNKFDNVVISYKKDTAYLNKVNLLAKELSEKNITCELMETGGKKEYFDETSVKINFSGIDLNLFSAIHLDIEPHTFDDWDTQKEKYLLQLENIILPAFVNFADGNGLKLNISAPLHYPESTLTHLFKNCDKVYFMAYENTNADYIARKTEPFSREYGNKLVVASRTRDFSNRLEMEKYLVENYSKYHFAQIALHDLAGLVEMDEKNMKSGQ